VTPEGLWLDPGPLTPETLGVASASMIAGGMLDGASDGQCLNCGLPRGELMGAEMLGSEVPGFELRGDMVPNGNSAPVIIDMQ